MIVRESRMGRGGRDEERSPETPSPQTGRMEQSERSDSIRELSDSVTRERYDAITEREHHLDLPTAADREQIRDASRAYHLRGSEVDLLERTACFRSVFTDDLRRSGGD